MTRQEVLRVIADLGDDAVECRIPGPGGFWQPIWWPWMVDRDFVKVQWRLKPQERYEELTMDDVPQGAEFRVVKGAGKRLIPIEINGSGIAWGNGWEIATWQQLKEYYEMRAPGGTWQPCRKAVLP